MPVTETSARLPHGERLAWHALDREEVERLLNTGPGGLTLAEAQTRQERYGPNELREAPPPTPLAVLLHQFRSPLIYILLIAAALTLALGDIIDAAAILAVLALNAGIGFTQEWKAEKAARALARLIAPQARIIREGREQVVESRALVPGDVVWLESGVRVPADLRLCSVTGLAVDESPLTGESLTVTKSSATLAVPVPLADRSNMAYAGTIVARGRARGYVVATATGTELGAIAEHVRRGERPDTPLQRRMHRFARRIGTVVAVAAVLAFGIGVLMGESPSHMFLVGVALAVSAVPEGLPVVLTITLARGARRMAQRNAIIRRLAAVETLGSTSTIGSDKTGTLTENRMTVREIWTAGRMFPVPELPPGEAAPVPAAAPGAAALTMTLRAGVLTNEAEIEPGADGWEIRGDPTDAALLVAAARLGLPPGETRAAHPPVVEVPFEPERQYSASLRTRFGQHVLFVKGAPERVLRMCARMAGDAGEEDLDPERIRRAVDDLASRGLRVLAMACRALPEAPPAGTGPAAGELPEPEGLLFLGLQGMLDPPRAGVPEAVAGCRDAGIRVVMITGDHAATARSIGRQLGILSEGEAVVTGAELDTLDEAALARRVGEVSIYARVTPEHKLRVVRALRSRGEVVAVTGDGVNDAPALKAADIGIAMGKSGTDVAREASDMLLADDNFTSIYAAVEEGRITFDNLRKVTFFLISTGAAEIITILATLVFRWPLPFLPAQILWLNLVTNGLQDVALAFEPGERGVLRRRPRSPQEGIISRLLWERTLLAGLVMAVGTLVLFRWALDRTGDLATAQTVALTTMVLFQMFHVGNCRSESHSIFQLSPISNPFLFLATGAALLVHVAALYLPGTRFVLRVEPLPAETWMHMIGVGLSILVVMELHKLVRSRAPGPPPSAVPAVVGAPGSGVS